MRNITTIIKNMMFAILLGLTSCAYASDVFVIANPFAVPGKSLSYSMIEDIFTLRNKKWENGTAIKVFILPRSNPRTKEFTIKYLNMSVNRYFDLLEGRESLGKGNLVDVANTEYEIMLKVLTTPGSIGYASDVVVINFSGNIVVVK